MSRRASPQNANPITVMVIARPGKMRIQGALARYWAAWPVSIRPQEGVGSEMPRPKKLSPASVRMAVPNMEDMIMSKGAAVFGKMCRSMILGLEDPMATAAKV